MEELKQSALLIGTKKGIVSLMIDVRDEYHNIVDKVIDVRKRLSINPFEIASEDTSVPNSEEMQDKKEKFPSI